MLERSRGVAALLESKLNPPEVPEAHRMIGRALIRANDSLYDEVAALEEIHAMYAEENEARRRQRQRHTSLPPPPVLEFLEKEIGFFVESLRARGDVLPEAQRRVLQYVEHRGGGGGGGGRDDSALGARPAAVRPARPQTADARAGRRPASGGSSGSGGGRTPPASPPRQPRQRAERPSTAAPRRTARQGPAVAEGGGATQEERVHIGDMGSALVAGLRMALESERVQLESRIQSIRDMLDMSIEDVQEEERALALTEAPPLQQMRETRAMLEKQFLKGDNPLVQLPSLGCGGGAGGGGLGRPAFAPALAPLGHVSLGPKGRSCDFCGFGSMRGGECDACGSPDPTAPKPPIAAAAAAPSKPPPAQKPKPKPKAASASRPPRSGAAASGARRRKELRPPARVVDV